MNELRFDNVTAGYGKTEILHSINFTVKAGSRVALVGSNGAGKSTLVQVANGLLPTISGNVFWGGTPIEELGASQRTRDGIATVPEGRLLFPDCTVLENLSVAGIFDRVKAHREANIERVFELFPKLRERAAQTAGTLSGGEQQMVAVGRALMTEPQLLILDEPSIGLAPRVVGEIFNALGVLAEEGLSLLLVEQNVEFSLQFADFAYVLQQGEITLSGTADDLANDPKVKAAYLGL